MDLWATTRWIGAGWFAGLAFAGPAPLPDIPGYRTVSNAISAKIAEPKTAGSARTGYLGVEVSMADGKLRVDDVEAQSPAARADVKVGDILVDLDTRPIANPEALRDELQSHKPGDSVKLSVRRGDDSLSLDVILAATSRPMRPRRPPGA